MSPATSVEISYGIYDAAIRQDSTPTMPDLQAFSKVGDLRSECSTSTPYATFEPDFWLLSGKYRFIPTGAAIRTVHPGVITQAQSDVDGVFATSPVLTVEFGTPRSIDSMTLKFAAESDDYCNDLDIAFYDQYDVEIATYHYEPAAWEFATEQAVNNIKSFTITFNGTNKAYRYLRLTGIDYGELITFDSTTIKAASVIEECNPTSVQVPFGTANILIHSADADFDILDPQGHYATLGKHQPVLIYETIAGHRILIGQYYLDVWDVPADEEMKFYCTDLLGVLDSLTYRGGIWLGAGIAVEDLLAAMLDPILAPWELDPDLYGTVITGWLPFCTYREALQQIALAIGAYVDCSRSVPVKIYKTYLAADETTYDTTILQTEQGAGQSLSMTSLVTGIRVTTHDIIEGVGILELFNGTLAVGSHEIPFGQPMHTLTVTGATISESGANYAILYVAAEGAVVLSGSVYEDMQSIKSVVDPEIPVTSVRSNILKIEDATLVNSANGQVVAQLVYDYNRQRLLQGLKLFASPIQTNDVLLVESTKSRYVRGTVISVETDLSGGFISKAKVQGVLHT